MRRHWIGCGVKRVTVESFEGRVSFLIQKDALGQMPWSSNAVCNLAMMPARATTLLGQIRRDLAEIQKLRHDIRRAPDQVSRDNAIIRHSRTLDKIIEALQQLEDQGQLKNFPVVK